MFATRIPATDTLAAHQLRTNAGLVRLSLSGDRTGHNRRTIYRTVPAMHRAACPAAKTIPLGGSPARLAA